MAFVEDEQEKKKQDEGQPITTGAGSHIISGEGGGDAGSQGTAPQAPGNFVGIQKYIDANKSQTSELASRLGDTVSTGIQTANDTINNEGDTFTGTVKGSANYDPTNPANATETRPTLNLQDIANDPDQSQAWQDTVGGVYTGPEKFVPSQTVSDTTKKAETTTGLAGTSEGLGQLTNQAYDPNKRATTGGSMLNQALLKSDPNARTTINNAVTKLPTIAETLSGVLEGTNKTVADVKERNKKLGDEIKNKPIEAATAIASAPHTDTVNEIVTGARDTAKGIKDYISSEFNKGKGKANFNLTPAQLESLGMTAEQWGPIAQRLGTVRDNYSDFEPWDFNSWFDDADPAAGITPGNSMSDDEYSKIVSLYKLAGQQPPAREARPKVTAMKFNPAKFETWIKDYVARNVNKNAPPAPEAPGPNTSGGFQPNQPSSPNPPGYVPGGTINIDPNVGNGGFQTFPSQPAPPPPPSNPGNPPGYVPGGTLEIDPGAWW
jgi:hypothetical protein